MPLTVNIAVEDNLSEVILRRLLAESGRLYVVGTRYPTSSRTYERVPPSGYGFIKKQLRTFNQAASSVPFVVLTDLDNNPCPAALVRAWLSEPLHPNLIFRVAVREAEAWLIADRSSLSVFLQIPLLRIPLNAEAVVDPKRQLVQLARHSRSSEIRDGMIPAPGSTATVGPYFGRIMAAFAKTTWSFSQAARNSESLSRAIAHFQRFQPRFA